VTSPKDTRSPSKTNRSPFYANHPALDKSKLAIYPCDEGLYLWLTAIVKLPINCFSEVPFLQHTYTCGSHTNQLWIAKHWELGSLLIGLESERSEDISDMRLTHVNESAENELISAVALLNIASLSSSSTRLTNAGGGRDPVFSFFHNSHVFKL
jgi:hypothetical protein